MSYFNKKSQSLIVEFNSVVRMACPSGKKGKYYKPFMLRVKDIRRLSSGEVTGLYGHKVNSNYEDIDSESRWYVVGWFEVLA